MRFWALIVSLVFLLAGALSGLSWILALGGVGLLCSLGWWGGAPTRLVIVFGAWVGGVLVYLLLAGSPGSLEAAPLLGLPASAFWMLFGIWVIPVLIWPLGFLRHFRRWKDR